MKMENIIELNNIYKSFTGVQALDNVTLHVKKGEIHALVGKNGAGKSTLIKILSGIYQKDEGEIIIDGKRTNISSSCEMGLLGIHFVYQEENLVPFLNAAENIFLGNEPKSVLPGFTSKRQMERKAKVIFEQLKEFSIDIHKPVMLLTSAQRTMVTIARVLISKNSKIMVFDEPTASLSYNEVNNLFAFINNLRKTGVSIIYVSHRLGEIFKLADSVTVLRDGKNIGTYKVSELNEKQLAEKITGTAAEMIDSNGKSRVLEKNRESLRPLMEARDLKVGNKVKSATFKIYKGEVVALVGLVGSGKTELAEAIFGYRKLDSGEIFIDGQKIKINSTASALRQGVSLIPEDRANKSLMLECSIRENLMIPNLKKISRSNILSRKKENKLTETILKDFSVKYVSQEQKINFLSGGNQQKVVVGGKVQDLPKLFIFDDISAGIDIGTKEYFYKIIREFAIRDNIPSLYITSDISEALLISDRVFVMQDGIITKQFLTSDLTEDILLHHILVMGNDENENNYKI